MITLELDKASQQQYNRSLRDYGKKAEKAIKDGIVKTCMSIETIAKQRLSGMMGSAKHIITNRLRASVHMEVKGMNSFRAVKDSKVSDGSLNVSIGNMEGVIGTNVDYAEAIENGFAPHEIKPRHAKVLVFKKGGKMIFTKKVNHPGFKGESYLRFAAEKEQTIFPDRIVEELNKIK